MKKVSDLKFGGSLPSMNKISGKQLHIADRLHVVSIKVIFIRNVKVFFVNIDKLIFEGVLLFSPTFLIIDFVI